MALTIIKRNPNLGWVGKELRETLAKHGIDVIETDERYGLDASVMYTSRYTDTGKPVIVFLAGDIINAGLNHKEVECLMWHEVGHIVHDMTELEADDFAVDHSGYEVWKSAVNKTYDYIRRSPTGKYAHRERHVG